MFGSFFGGWMLNTYGAVVLYRLGVFLMFTSGTLYYISNYCEKHKHRQKMFIRGSSVTSIDLDDLDDILEDQSRGHLP